MQALLSVFLGYLAYYIVRNNFTLSTPYLKEQLDLSATQIGLLQQLYAHCVRNQQRRHEQPRR
ncbi:sn-glycerol-3-phosphate transporter [Citrobacter koseri]|nr:sn-glycerol-3-phosphate transporter [Citrobacter koseri]